MNRSKQTNYCQGNRGTVKRWKCFTPYSAARGVVRPGVAATYNITLRIHLEYVKQKSADRALPIYQTPDQIYRIALSYEREDKYDKTYKIFIGGLASDQNGASELNPNWILPTLPTGWTEPTQGRKQW